MDIVSAIFETRDCLTEIMIEDGEAILKGTTIMKIKGAANSILEVERVALNILARMSGIATETNKLSEKISKYFDQIGIGNKIKVSLFGFKTTNNS